jgi:putative peptidoglycan lipid II flippase
VKLLSPAVRFFGTPRGRGTGFSLMSLGNLLAAALMYVRQAEIARLFGTDWHTDAFAVALVLPTLIREVIANSFGTTFLPVYSDVMKNRGPEKARELVDRILSWIGLSGLLLSGAILVLARQLVIAAGPGLSDRAADLSRSMLLILVPTVLFSALSGVLQGLFNYQRKFGVTALLRIAEIVASLAVVLLLPGVIGIYVLPVSVLAGCAAMFVVLIFGCARIRYRYRPILDPRDSDFARQLRMAWPIIAGTLLGLLAPVINRVLASFLQESSVTALEYSDRILKIVLSVAFIPLMTLAETSFSALTAERDLDGFRKELRELLEWCTLGMAPVAVFLTVLAAPVVSVLFQRGSFTVENTLLVGWGLAFYAPWLAQFGFGSIVSRGFYAMKDTMTPVLVGVWCMVVNVLLSFILIGPLGIGGLALAITLSSTAKTVLLFMLLRHRAGRLGGAAIASDQVRILVPAGVMAVALVVLARMLPFDYSAAMPTRLLILVAYSAAGFGIFAAGSLALRSPAMLKLERSAGERLRRLAGR